MFVISVKMSEPINHEMYLAYNKTKKCYWTESYLDEDAKKFETMFDAAQFFNSNELNKAYPIVSKPILKQIVTTEVGPL